MALDEDVVAGCDRLAMALRGFYARAQRVADKRLTAHGTSIARMKLLQFISQEGVVRSADIASCFGQAPRTVTEAIDGLERDGLIRRDPDPEDRRAKRISLTEAGREVIRASAPTRNAFLVDLFGVLDAAEREEMVDLLGRLNRRLEELGG